MKILCEYTPSGPSYVRGGWGRAFKAAGHDFRFWAPEAKSIMDAMNEFEPDIFLGTTYGVDRALMKCIAARPQMKVGLFASAWGSTIDEIDTEKYPIVVVGEQERKLIEQLKATTGRPDFVFIHVTDEYLEPTMGGWRSIGIEPLGVLNACDVVHYHQAVPMPELKCDVAFVGGRWPFKARNLDAFLTPLCHPSSGLNVKIFGNKPWPVHQYLGLIDDDAVKHLFNSATVCPNVSEPHSTDLGFDLIERPYKVMGSGGFCVSDYVDEARCLFTESELIMCRTASEFRDTIQHFVDSPDDRLPYIRAGMLAVLLRHTYFDRVAQMLGGFGLRDEADKLMDVKTKFIEYKYGRPLLLSGEH